MILVYVSIIFVFTFMMLVHYYLSWYSRPESSYNENTNFL